MIKDIIKTLRIKHWIKNFVVFIPLIFSLSFYSKTCIISAIIGFFAFCFISSSVYIFNDILDLENDKKHPLKRFRPIASGKIPIQAAWIMLLILLFASLGFSYILLPASSAIILAYFILNIFYSTYLKYQSIIDVVCIALGFVLRVLLGCVIIHVQPSALVILLTFFTSMFFTFSKRKLEYGLVNSEKQRKSIKEYNEPLLNQYIGMNAILSIAFYLTYMLDSSTITRAGTQYIYITVIPFSIIIYRLLFLIFTHNDCDDPANLIYSDRTLHVLTIIYILTYITILTLPHFI